MKPMDSIQQFETGQIKSKFDMNSTSNKISFLCFGIGMLMPWNAMLAAMDFYTDVYPSYKPSFSLIVAVSAPIFGVQALVFFLM